MEMSFPTASLRFVKRKVPLPMSKQTSTELVLQQRWKVYDYETGRADYFEWRDVPIVEEESDIPNPKTEENEQTP